MENFLADSSQVSVALKDALDLPLPAIVKTQRRADPHHRGALRGGVSGASNPAIDPMPQSDSSYRNARPAQAHCAASDLRLLDAQWLRIF